MLERELSNAVIQCFYKVYNTLGYINQGISSRKQCPIKVFYDQVIVGEYFADIIVNDVLVIELKAAEVLVLEHEYQLINYLKATEIEVGLLLNFGKEPKFIRKVFSNERKRLK